MSNASMIAAVAVLGCAGCSSSAASRPASNNTSSNGAASSSVASQGTTSRDTTSGPTGTESSPGGGLHPCDLLTAAEMTDFFGASVESHEIPYETVTTGVQCLWNRVSESVGGADKLPAHYVLVQALTEDYDLQKLHRKIAGGGIQGISELVPDIGDGAILIAGGEGIDVAVGKFGFNLLIAVDPVPTPAAIEALARSAVSRMP